MRALLRSTAIYGLADIAGRLLTFLAFLVFAHLVTVAEFGIIALVSSIGALIALVGNLGMNNAVQRYYLDPGTATSQRPEVVSAGLGVLAVSATLSACVALAVLGPFQETLELQFGLRWPYLVAAAITAVISQALLFLQDVLRIHFAPWRFALLSIVRNIATLSFALLLVGPANLGVGGYFWGVFIGVAAALPLAIWLTRRDLRVAFDRPLAAALTRFGYPFVFSGFAVWLMASADLWLLGRLADSEQVGVYSIAIRFASMLVLINTAMAQAWAPYALSAYAKDPHYREMVGRFFSYWFYGLTLLGIALALFSGEVLRLLTPSQYWPAAGPLAILAGGAVLLGTTQVTVLGLSLEKRSGVIAACAWVAAILNVGLNVFLIPILGATGAACANALGNSVLTGLYLVLAQRLHPVPLEAPKLFVTLTLLVVGILFAYYVGQLPWSTSLFLLKWLVLGVAIVAGALTGVFRPGQLRQLATSLLGRHGVTNPGQHPEA